MFRVLVRLLVCGLALLLLFILLVDSASARPPTYLPWQAGVTYRVTQGNNGGYSHNTAYTRYGWDFGIPAGVSVAAAAPGRVAKAGWDSTGYGNAVVVCYGDGTCSRYAHLSSISVGVGQSVGQAQEVGRVGSTGNSSGPHLHYQLENGSGISLASSFAEAGVPGTGAAVTSQNRGGPAKPVFADMLVYSSSTLDVTAGDQVRAVVRARYVGPTPIPCGNANFGVRGDQPARWGDHPSYWPNSPWRAPNRAAAVGCEGNLDPGEWAEWHLTFRPPIGTSSGVYDTGVYAPVWEGVAWADLETAIRLRVQARYQAAFVDQSITPLTAPGTTGRVSVTLRNVGLNTWRQDEVFLGTRSDQPFPYADDSWGANRNRLRMQRATVAPGETARFEGSFQPPVGSAALRHRQYFAPVLEGRDWFSQELGIYQTMFVGDAGHLPFAAEDYGATWVGQTYLDRNLRRGDTAEVRVTYRNSGLAVLFDGGSHPVNLRGILPTDRTSGFIDPTHPKAVGKAQGVRLDQSRVDPGELFTYTIPVKVADWVPPGNYREYFRPVAEGIGWFGPTDVWWPVTVEPSSG